MVDSESWNVQFFDEKCVENVTSDEEGSSS